MSDAAYKDEAMTDPIAFAFDTPHAASDAERQAMLGGKGKSLSDMTAVMGLPVPPGFTLATSACRSWLDSGWSSAFDAAIDHHLARVEAMLGRRFGDPANPLLLSVRSGGAASMPGMMDTVLNIGLNADILPGFAACSGGDAAFAADCLMRLRDSFVKSVGGAPPQDPRQQLRAAIEAVFQSWNSDRAIAYRRIEGIADDAGTAVTIQAMVFGNRDDRSGTGVVFSRNPSTGEPQLFGDILFRAQGEDVVSGAHRTMDIADLAARLPDVAADLDRMMHAIERHYRDLVDVEFTIESGRLWILQARPGKRAPHAAIRIAHDMASDADFPLSHREALARVRPLIGSAGLFTRTVGAETVLGTGLGASPGIASGALVTSTEDAVLRSADGEPVILARPETSPEDIEGIAAAAGLLTSRGGLASHAAVVARGWGKPAVVGLDVMQVDGSGIVIDSTTIAVGTMISIDGATGEVFLGGVQGTMLSVPEAEAMLVWDIEETAVEPIGQSAPIDDDALLLLIALKGFCAREAAMDIGCIDEAGLAERLERLSSVIDATSPRFLKLREDGKRQAEALIMTHRAALGQGAARDLLHSFHGRNDRFKSLVTDWQMRSVPGAEPIFNDHSDAAYDAQVLGRMDGLHSDTLGWLDRVGEGGPVGLFRSRFVRALARLKAGQTAYLASPKVDSYHNVWFELHEYLIRLAGMTRAQAEGHG